MRDYKDTLAWLRSHKTAAELGFTPDHECLRITRTARDLTSRYPSAKAQQDATPTKDRVHNIADLRAGMPLFFDDPNDSNKWGHVVTLMGRAQGEKANDLRSLIVMTNSVKTGKLVAVRGDYFPRHWGDSFQFGAKSLEGHEIDWAGKVAPKSEMDQVDDNAPRYAVGHLDAAAHNGRPAAKEAVQRINKLVKSLPHDDADSRVNQFVAEFKKTRVLRMGLLSGAVHFGERHGVVEDVFKELMAILNGLPKS